MRAYPLERMLGRGQGVRAAAAVISAIALLALSALPAGAAPAWTVVNDASTPAATELTSVACVSATRCFAVGYREANDDYKGVIEQGIGKAWKRMSRPEPANRQPGTFPPLTSVVCSVPGNCFAVGSYLNASGNSTALIDHWNGKSWGLMKAGPPIQGGTQTSLNSVACPTATSCYAVGYYVSADGVVTTLVEHWNGKIWTAQAAPTSGALTTVLRGVACVSDTSCFSVGTAMGAKSTKPFVVRWNGTAWSTMTSPGLQFAGLDDIACSGPKLCFAIGSVVGGKTSTLLERWNGTKWSVVTLKNMPTANHLFGIACPTATTCFAVGRKTWTTAGFQTLVLRWNGTTWAPMTTPNQADATSNWLNGVACASATQCRAVGTYLKDGTYHSLVQNYG